MLMTKRQTGAGLTTAIRFGTLAANWFLLVTLELPLTASQAVVMLVWLTVQRSDSARSLPSCARPHTGVCFAIELCAGAGSEACCLLDSGNE